MYNIIMDTLSIMRANKDYSKAFIDCWFMHTCCSHKVRALYKPESLCMLLFRPMFYNVDALLLLSNTNQC